MGFQLTVTAKKCFVSTADTDHNNSPFLLSWETCRRAPVVEAAPVDHPVDLPVEVHLVEDEPEQQRCWGWARTAAWTEISIVEVDAALCLEPVTEWWNFEEVMSSWDRKGFCVCDVECAESWEVYTFYQTQCLSVQDSDIWDLWNMHIWTALCMDSFFVGQPLEWTTHSWQVLPFRCKFWVSEFCRAGTSYHY